MTVPQLETIDAMERIAIESGATLSFDEFDIGSDGGLILEVQYGADQDYERVTYTLTREGSTVIW